MNVFIKKLFKKAAAPLCIILAAVLCFFCVGCSGASGDDSRTLMTAGGYEVPYDVVRYVVMNLKKDGITEEGELRERTLAAIRDIYAVFALASDYGMEFDDEFIASLASQAKDSDVEEMGGKKAFKESLKENCMTDSVYMLMAKKDVLRDEIMRSMISMGDIETDEEKLREIIESDEFIRVKQILVTSGSTATTEDGVYIVNGETHTEEEAKELAAEAQKKAAGGEDFDALVAEYGQSFYMFGNTDGYYICRGMWDSVNENAAFALNVGEVSEVIESDVGYSVFKRYEKSGDYIDSHFDEICTNWYNACYVNALEKKTAFTDIETGEEFDGMSLADMK